MTTSSVPCASLSARCSTRFGRLSRRLWPGRLVLMLAVLGLLPALARAELPSAGHIWVLAVNGTLTVRDAATLRFMGQGPATGTLAPSGNRKRVFGMDAATGQVFELHLKTMAPTPLIDLKAPQSALCANPDGSRLLLVSNAKKTAALVDTMTKQPLPLSGELPRIKSCQFSLDGQLAYLIPSGADDVVTVDIKANKLAGQLALAAPPSRIHDFAIHPNPAKRLALVSDGTRIVFLDTATHKPQGNELAMGTAIRSVAFHPNGTLFFALSDDKVFWIDLQTRQLQKVLELAPGGTFRTLTIDGLGRRLFASGNHEINEGLGAVINTQGKEFVAIDIDSKKKLYQDFSPVLTVQYLVSP